MIRPWMTIPLVPPLPTGFSCQPGVLGPKLPCPAPSREHRREPPIRHCSRWGLPCRPCCQVRGGLLPHRFTITHAEAGAVSSLWRFPWGCPRRALPGTVSSWSPDFPRAVLAGDARSSGHPRRRRHRAAPTPRQCGRYPPGGRPQCGAFSMAKTFSKRPSASAPRRNRTRSTQISDGVGDCASSPITSAT